MATRRLELGFEGGTVLRLTVDEAVSTEVTGALSGQAQPGWRSVEAEEGTFWINEGELLYVLNLQQLGELEFTPTDLPSDSFIAPSPLIQFGSGDLISLRSLPLAPIGSRTLTPIGSSSLPGLPLRRF